MLKLGVVSAVYSYISSICSLNVQNNPRFSLILEKSQDFLLKRHTSWLQSIFACLIYMTGFGWFSTSSTVTCLLSVKVYLWFIDDDRSCWWWKAFCHFLFILHSVQHKWLHLDIKDTSFAEFLKRCTRHTFFTSYKKLYMFLCLKNILSVNRRNFGRLEFIRHVSIDTDLYSHVRCTLTLCAATWKVAPLFAFNGSLGLQDILFSFFAVVWYS